MGTKSAGVRLRPSVFFYLLLLLLRLLMLLRFCLYVFVLCFSNKAICSGLVELQAFGLTEGWEREGELSNLPDFTKRRTRYFSNDIRYKKSGFNKDLEITKSKHKKDSLLCYKSLLKRKPKASGRVFFKFKISSKSGKISSLKVSPSHWADQKFKNCVNRSLLAKNFKLPKGNDLTISYPLVFKSVY